MVEYLVVYKDSDWTKWDRHQIRYQTEEEFIRNMSEHHGQNLITIAKIIMGDTEQLLSIRGQYVKILDSRLREAFGH